MGPTTARNEEPGEPDDEVELGSVIGVFGFRGELRLHLHNPSSDLLATPKPVILVDDDGVRRPAVLSARPGAGNRVIGRLVGVDDDVAATALRGVRIRIAKTELPSLDPDEYYVWQLEGAAVEIDDVRVGTVVRVHDSEHDIFEIRRNDGEIVFVPALHEFVLAVDPIDGAVRLVPGALDDDPEP